MRLLSERMKGRETDTLDGIRVFEGDGWAQVLPDAAEPLVHVYAEGATPEESARLGTEYATLVESIVAGADGDPS